MVTKHSAAHWGATRAKVEAGRLVAIEAFEKDENPYAIIKSMAAGLGPKRP